MKHIHATPARNAEVIMRDGLRAEKSKSRTLLTVWLTTPGNRDWAVRHAKTRHDAKAVCLFEVDVPRGWLAKPQSWKLWHTSGRDVPPERIRLLETVTLA